jgi:hypothetical protein
MENKNNYYPFARLAIIDVILAKGYKVNEVIDLSLTYYQKGVKDINVYTHVLEMGNEW